MGSRFLCLSCFLCVGLLVLGRAVQAQTELPDQDQLFAEADARIEAHRKADAAVVVVDTDGRPVTDVQIVVEQTRHAFLFGSNIFKFGGFDDPQDELEYRNRFREVFNFATLPFYWPSYEPRRGQPRHDRAEAAAQWCRDHGIRTKGHPLAWNFADPRWLPDDSDEVKRLQSERITNCVSRFRGLIDTWDVVNEATHFERDEFRRRAPKMTAMWEQVGRVDFVEQCFKLARDANPAATLLINDYRTDSDYARLLDDLIQTAGKRPYDVIGLQSHMHSGAWDNEKIWEVCERFRRFDVPLHFTELTILSGAEGWERAGNEDDWPTTDEGEQRQAVEVERVYTMLFSHPAVAAITWWDFADQGAWQRAPAGFLRKDLSPKPGYSKLVDLIKGKWWTNVEGRTTEEGQFTFRGFYGDYVVRARTSDGRTAMKNVVLSKAGPNRFELPLDEQ